MTGFRTYLKITMAALCWLVVAMPGWAQTAETVTTAKEVKAGTPVRPGETKCRYPLPTHRKWGKHEIWAWKDRICLGKIADMSAYDGGDGKGCDPKKADGWPKTRNLSNEFLQTILDHQPHRGALTRSGVRIQCARFRETVDLSGMVLAHPLWLDKSRFRRTVNFTDLRSASLISLEASVLDGRFRADRLKVAASLFLRGKAHFKKEVRLLGAKIGGQLSTIGSTFDGRFRADGLEVAGPLFMRGKAHFKKEVRLLGAKIGGQLSAIGSTFDGRFNANRFQVVGSLFMRNGASFKDINLRGAKIGGSLQFRGGVFNGHVDLTSASIGDELRLTAPPPRWTKKSRLTLRNTRVGALNDTVEAWPDRIDLTGFTYDRLGGLNSTLTDRPNKQLREWLAKQNGYKTTYNPQPFEQLAKVLRDSGYPGKADAILFAARSHQRDSPKTPWLTEIKLWVQWGLIGYGYKNWLALIWFLALTGLGTLACRRSDLQGWQRFWYSFDMALPIVELNAHHKDVVLTNRTAVYFYIHKMGGFVFVSFLIAGLSGLTK